MTRLKVTMIRQTPSESSFKESALASIGPVHQVNQSRPTGFFQILRRD